AVGRLFRERLQTEVVEPRVEFGPDGGRPRRFRLAVPAHQLVLGPGEERRAGQQAEQNHAQAVHVGAGGNVAEPAARFPLFGSHVRGRTLNGPDRRGGEVEPAGETEVGDQQLTLTHVRRVGRSRVVEYVRRFQVAVDQPARVGRFQTARDLL